MSNHRNNIEGIALQKQTVHLIGIGGSGLSAIAWVLFESGVKVSGSDKVISAQARKLKDAGVTVFEGHHPDHVRGVDLVLRSSAVPMTNIEVKAALDMGIPVVTRNEFLPYLLNQHFTIAIAGTHGKTTTTAMVAWLLSELDLDPSYIIGGESKNLGTNAHAGRGRYFIIEADEYGRMFHGLHPDLAVITNVEHDHPDCFPTFAEFKLAFIEFVRSMKRNASLIGCSDDPGAVEVMYQVESEGYEVFRYSIDAGTDYSARELSLNDGCYSFDFYKGNTKLCEITLQVPGLHNVRNSVAALAIIDQLELPIRGAANSIKNYIGVERRFDIRGEAGGVIVIDDYAHHPTEIKVSLQAAREKYPHHNLWVVWQPHTFSRVDLLLRDFQEAFNPADHVCITDVYAARETKPANFSMDRIEDQFHHHDVRITGDLKHTTALLLEELTEGDVLVVLSAGDADEVSKAVFMGLVDKTQEMKRWSH